MIQVRYNLWETNSSSACTFTVTVYRPDSIKIPKVVHIDSRDYDDKVNRAYIFSGRDDEEEQFLAMLGSVGVEEIYVDGKPVSPNLNAGELKMKELRLAIMFAEDCKTFSEWHSWGDEIGDGPDGINVRDRYYIQQKVKDPNYEVVVCDGDEYVEIPWDECCISKEVYTEEDLKRWEKWDQHVAEIRKQEEEREKEWQEYKTKFLEKYGIDLDTYQDIYDEAITTFDETIKDEDYYEKLQEAMVQTYLKRKKK